MKRECKLFRIFSLVLALITLLSIFTLVSCGEVENETTDTTAVIAETTVAESAETTDFSYSSKLIPSDLKFNKEEITLISRNETGINDEFYVNDISGSLIADSVYARNLKVESDLSVKFNMVLSNTSDAYDVSSAARNAYKTADHLYDIIVNSTYSTIRYCNEGYLTNLKRCEYLDLDAEYWSKGFNEAASIGNAQYMATGPISLSTYRFTFVTFFNKNLFESKNMESLYTVVKEGRWTLEYQMKIVDDFYVDVNGDQSCDENDIYGFVSNTLSYADPYISSCNNTFIKKDAENYLVFDVNLEHVTDVNDKVLELYWKHKSFIGTDGGDSGFQTRVVKFFSENRAATATMRLVTVETDSIRNMENEYGIIPMPKYDQEQAQYGSFMHDQFNSVGIPATVPDNARLQMIGAVVEQMAVASANITVPNYYEIALKGRYLRDSESSEMLDLIYNSMKIDPGVIYNDTCGNVYTLVRAVVGTKNNTTASLYNGYKKTVPKKVTAFNDAMKDLQTK